MIEMHALSRRYDDLLAVDNLSCRIAQGEVVGLLGHNGAGKTTIMKMLTGFLEPSSGTIRINGHNMATQRKSIQKELGYLPENCPVYSDMTVADYLAFRADMLGVPTSEQPAALRQALVHTGLADRAMHSIATLSRGLRQRVGVAQAILHHPSIVILDEPTNGLDPEQIGQMRNLVRGLAEHATVIISTHILSEVEAVCERVLMMRKGKLALDARLDELEQEASLVLEVGSDADLTAAVSALDGVQKVEATAANAYRLQLAEGGWQPTAARVAELVHSKQLPLHRLAPEVRSLETIFREVNEQANQEVTHA